MTDSQNYAAMSLRCGGICNDHFAANFVLSLTAKEFWKLHNTIWLAICFKSDEIQLRNWEQYCLEVDMSVAYLKCHNWWMPVPFYHATYTVESLLVIDNKLTCTT